MNDAMRTPSDACVFDSARDLDHASAWRMNQNPRRASETMLLRVRAAIPLHHQDGAAREAAERILKELVSNAVERSRWAVPRASWRIALRIDGLDVVWIVSNDGAGMVEAFRKATTDHHGDMDDDALLDALLHRRTTSMTGDPNAGLGHVDAMRKAGSLGAGLELRTSGRRLVLKDGRMVPAGSSEGVGTTWTIRIPMLDDAGLATRRAERLATLAKEAEEKAAEALSSERRRARELLGLDEALAQAAAEIMALTLPVSLQAMPTLDRLAFVLGSSVVPSTAGRTDG